jgi:hypothetical protein
MVMRDIFRWALSFNINPDTESRAYALALLAGLKLRKARVALMIDQGRLSRQAADKVATALSKYNGRVPCADVRDVREAVECLRAAYMVWGTAALAQAIVDYQKGVYPRHIITAVDAPQAHAGLAQVLAVCGDSEEMVARIFDGYVRLDR